MKKLYELVSTFSILKNYYLFFKLKEYDKGRKEQKDMKHTLFLVLKNVPLAYETLDELKQAGFNATIVSTESLRHALDYYPEEHHFFNLRHLETKDFVESILCLFVVEEEKLEKIKNVIRNRTDNFKNIKGFMFSLPINDYEGSII